jgi:5-methylcytosine-specific restriction protein A
VRISDLPAPVTASKADWLAGTSWLGFTPPDGTSSSHAQCQSTINRQINNGYVIEYITETFSNPNPGFENDPATLGERQNHSKLAGRFVAVHRLRPSARALQDIIGNDDFKRLQDMWAQPEKRYRWSVAFPIIESYEVKGRPKAKDVLGTDAYRRLYGHSSAVLRPLNDEEREAIADLELEPLSAPNARIGIEDEFERAERSEINSRTRALIADDLPISTPEGLTKERWQRVRLRAMWLADRFIRSRQAAGTLRCDSCEFDPSTRSDLSGIRPRTLLDVHHKDPLAEGVRYTTISDFSLLCPTCHRIVHARMRASLVL